MAKLNSVHQFEACAAVMETVLRQDARYGYGRIRFVLRERFSAIRVDTGGDNRRLGLERAQDLPGTLAVAKRERGDAVASDDLSERRKVAGQAVPQTDHVRDDEPEARQQHGGGARQQ